ncbi:glycosyltransferase family 4 protein [Yeosuana sp. MJ-SS3]|uniref:Glycosyltransferase family 4 protein n=1 Tax=Gilvirhabdus luticola TaxID=3079858 RepID=A0ABU3U2Q9_9FLAO|nr:glycosyltransferase family 4 protein [Yeosuana sp. MJ-SS3]MDU8884637.1 glycosyltransferase family 4 protein [Yeosuana sp. MJ-SS3]
MKEVFILTSYYPPEIGAASNRIFHLANGLQKHNFQVSVITPLPNYPTGKIFEPYKRKFKVSTIENGIKIYRLWIYATNSKNKFIRLLAMLSYSFSLMWFFLWNKIPQTVIVQSPPLLVAFTSMLLLKSKKRKLVLNVSDLWPIVGVELGVFKKNFGYELLEKIERFNYRKADLVLGQSEEILSHVTSLIPQKEAFLYRNYPDFEPPEIEFSNSDENTIKLVYAGLLGVAQGIYKLCQELDYNNMEFHIYGSGSEQKKIEQFISNNKELPIFYHGELKRNDLHDKIIKHDAAIIPLQNRIYGSVPSKIFEYARLGLPMIYFGGGEGEQIIENLELGWAVKPNDYTGLNNVISEVRNLKIDLKSKAKIRETAYEKFDFETQLNRLEKLI